jgi:host factor-I protein
MKDTDATVVGRAQEMEGFANRKLIRPSLNRGAEQRAGVAPERRVERSSNAPRKTPPPEQTHAENFYYQKQMQTKTPMVVVLQDGEALQGVIEWYDRSCIKLNRSDGSNVLVYKLAIKYMYKAGEAGAKTSA